MSTKIRPELQIKPGAQSQVLTTVDGKATWADAQLPDISNITNLESQLETKADKVDTYTKEQVDQKVSDLVGSAPETLNTLQEIAAALNNDENAYTSLSNALRQYIDEKTSDVVDAADIDALKTKIIKAFSDLISELESNFTKISFSKTNLPEDIKYTVSSPVNANSNISSLVVAEANDASLSQFMTIDVYLNGVLQDKGSDYTLSGDGFFTYNALVVGDVIAIKFRPRQYIDEQLTEVDGRLTSSPDTTINS